jgi:hypothetical protein
VTQHLFQLPITCPGSPWSVEGWSPQSVSGKSLIPMGKGVQKNDCICKALGHISNHSACPEAGNQEEYGHEYEGPTPALSPSDRHSCKVLPDTQSQARSQMVNSVKSPLP